jgi:outer membrane lipoprotein-sorting protein
MTRTSVAVLIAAATCTLAPSARALTGREVIDTAQQKNGLSTWKDRTQAATMESFDKQSLARSRDLDVSEQTDPRGDHRTFMEFTSPSDVKGTRYLHLSPRNEKDQQWLWSPTTRRVRRMGDAQRDENFFGTDLSYRDLELLVRIQQWSEAEATASLEADEELDGKPCHVVALEPRNDEFPYSRYRLWFGTSDYLPWRVDVYDREGRLFKRIKPARYERLQGYATPMEADVANVQYGTHTVYRIRDVRYDTGVSGDVFNVANLSGGR